LIKPTIRKIRQIFAVFAMATKYPASTKKYGKSVKIA
jgi:hypothetical protein